MAGDPDAARLAARGHMSYVEGTLREIQRVGAWEEVAERRLSRLNPKPATRKSVPPTRSKARAAPSGRRTAAPPTVSTPASGPSE